MTRPFLFLEGEADYIIGTPRTLLTDDWRREFPNFLPQELACQRGHCPHCNGRLKLHVPALCALQRVRDRFERPMIVNSAYRCPEYNRSPVVGSNDNSDHPKGRGFDVSILRDPVVEGPYLERLALEEGFNAIGRYSTFIHIGMRPPKPSGGIYQWGEWR